MTFHIHIKTKTMKKINIYMQHYSSKCAGLLLGFLLRSQAKSGSE